MSASSIVEYDRITRRFLRLALACAILTALAFAVEVRGQTADVLASPSSAEEPRVTFTMHTGVLSLITRGEKGEFFAARGSLNVTASERFTAFGRVDVTGNQDGGSLDQFLDPRAFRSMEGVVGLRVALNELWSVPCVSGVTWSIEGGEDVPVDGTLYTGACGARFALGDDGYVYGAVGYHGPIGGWGLLLSVVYPMDAHEHTATFVDFALPFDRNAFDEKTWTLKIGGAVRLWKKKL